jgi:hypothetical protein
MGAGEHGCGLDCPWSGSEKLRTWLEPGSDPKVWGSGLEISQNFRTPNLNFTGKINLNEIAVVEHI